MAKNRTGIKIGSFKEKTKKSAKPLSAAPAVVDPALAALFNSSIVPIVNKWKTSSTQSSKARSRTAAASSDGPWSESEDDKLSSIEILDVEDSLLSDEVLGSGTENGPSLKSRDLKQNLGKRRRGNREDDIEGNYLQRLAVEEAKEELQRQKERLTKRQKLDGDVDANPSAVDEEGEHIEAGSQPLPDASLSQSPPPQHETLAATSQPDDSLEQATRTIFLSNVSTTAITSKSDYTTLTTHLSSHLSSLPSSNPPHKILSLRFRSTPYADSSLPRKAAFAKKAIMTSTTKSTNAYVVYSTVLAAREAVKRLNGTVVLDRHLRVDSVAHPSPTDHRRCVFVGNLGFVDDESAIRAAEDAGKNISKPRKQKQAADLEEGLWRQFWKAGEVESVRVVRDKTTRVGKGFAYVQFKDGNAVEKALLFNGKAFPPLLPRTLRVTRAKNVTKTASYSNISARSKGPVRGPTQKPSSQAQSLSGRAGKLLGRAGAAQLKKGVKTSDPALGVRKSPEQVVFEGYRAKGGEKPALGRLKKGKVMGRSAKRGAAFKKAGGKKKRV